MFELSLNCFYFAHEISTSLLTLLSNSLQEIFDDKLFQARANLWFILGLSTKLFLKFWKGCQNCFFRCWMKTSCNENFPWEKILSLIFFLRFGSYIFKNVCEKIREKLVKVFSTCREDSVGQFCYRKFWNFNFCLTFSGLSLDFSTKCGCQNCNLPVQMKNLLTFFSLKNIVRYMFQNFNQKVIVTSAKFFGLGCRNCKLTVWKILLMIMFFK